MNKMVAIQATQTRQLFSASNMAQIASIILAALLAYKQSEVINSEVVLAWVFTVTLVALLRAVLSIAYQWSNLDDNSSKYFWLTRFRFGVFVSGMAWASASILLFPANNPEHQIFLIFILAGLSAGALVSYAADIISAITFIVLVISPLIIRMFLAGDSLSVSMSMGLTLYLGFMIMNLKNINRNISENIILHIEAAEREKIANISEQRYRLLLNHSPLGIIHYDNSLSITYWNDRFANMLHAPADYLNGLNLNTIKDQSVLPALRKALDGEIGYYEGLYSTTFRDAKKWVAVICSPSFDSDGKIEGGVAIVQDISERKLAEEQIHNLAFYDSLTNVPNRRLLNDRLGQTIAASKRNSRYGALMFLDLDNFKPLNDTYGHDVGDLLLIEAARRIGSCIRENDTVARFGGDEFVVMLSELNENQLKSTEQARSIAEKIRSLMSEPYQFVVKQDGEAEVLVEHQCTSSIGVVVFDYHASREDILKRADVAMYEAKNSGRNCVVFNKQSWGNTEIDVEVTSISSC